MLVKNTELGTFTRLVYHNTKISATKGWMCTWGPAGLLVATATAYMLLAITGLPVLWRFPVLWLTTFLVLLMLDAIIGTINTLTELRVLDTLEIRRDHCCETCEEEGEQGGEEGSGVC